MVMMKEEMYEYEDNFVPCVEQIPEELTWMIDFLLAKNIREILTFGVSRGGVEYRIAEAYHKAGKQCNILGIDWVFTEEMKQTWAKVLDKFPGINLNFLRHDLTKFCPYFMLGKYEFSFIDAEHLYEAVKRDFSIAIKHTTRFIGFHDIRGITGVTPFWEELKKDYIHAEKAMIDSMGIGIISVSGEPIND
jgi:hypothetical protein